jgi:hypothetical protein
MGVFKDLVGQVFDRWTVLRCTERRDKGGNVLWLCRCLCGQEGEIPGRTLVRGDSRSCGCLWREMHAAQRGENHPMFGRRGPKAPSFKHGHSTDVAGFTLTYSVWHNMISRCTNSNHSSFRCYGGANPSVRVCERWRNSFEAFLADMGECPLTYTLSRFLDSGSYELGNVEWATRAQQGSEKRGKHAMRRFRAWKEQQAQQEILAVAA